MHNQDLGFGDDDDDKLEAKTHTNLFQLIWAKEIRRVPIELSDSTSYFAVRLTQNIVKI